MTHSAVVGVSSSRNKVAPASLAGDQLKRQRKLLGAKGIANRNKDATRGSWLGRSVEASKES